jgi:hypothetical protein
MATAQSREDHPCNGISDRALAVKYESLYPEMILWELGPRSCEFWARQIGSSMIGLSAWGKSRARLSTFLVASKPADGPAVKGGVAVPEGREDRRRSVSGAEDRSALEGWPAVGYSSGPVVGFGL